MDSLYSLINIDMDKKEMICLVGAGGKTSAMFRLARELSAEGKRVLVTTTTAIYYPGRDQYDQILISCREASDLFDNRSGGVTVFGKSVSSEGKLLGVNPEFLDEIFLMGIFDYIIVEGDGSKGRPVKAPAGHEPVIPSRTTRLLGLVGLDCIGKEAGERYVHRPEFFERVTGAKPGDIIDAERIYRLVVHREGLFKAAPALSRKYLLLNKADSGMEKKAACHVVKKLKQSGFDLDGVVICSMSKPCFTKGLKRISGIILASGLSRRMGTDKLLLPVGGIPVIERVISAASESELEEIILVYGSGEIASIGSKYRVKPVHNNDPAQGQSRSIRLGVENSSPVADGYMFLVGDQPFISKNVINRLLESFIPEACSAVVPVYNGNRGNPVIFAASLRDRLMSLTGDIGGRTLLGELEKSIVTVCFADGRTGCDFDTREEYEAVLLQEDKK